MKRAIPRRFLITYAAAFALLYGLGFFITGRHIDAHWATLPFDPHRKITPFVDWVETFIVQNADGTIEYVTMNSEQMDIATDRGTMPYEDPGFLGSVHFRHTESSSVLAPFVTRTDDIIGARLSTDHGASIPDEWAEAAKDLAYAEARRSLYVPYFHATDLRKNVDAIDGCLGGVQLIGPWEPLLPIWLILIFFAFVPLAAAWAFTAISVRRHQT